MLVISRIHYYRNQSIHYYNPILLIYFTAFYFFISQKVFRIPGDSTLEEARLSSVLESLQHQERKISSLLLRLVNLSIFLSNQLTLH